LELRCRARLWPPDVMQDQAWLRRN
jgi:hypothetical protein